MKIITMYLPQFHRTEINDRLWGDGYTDWTAVQNACKLFEGHDQPRVPAGWNYYDLSKREAMEWQWSLAEEYGIYGFCFYHYYFGRGRMALNEPAENLLKWADLPMRFCFSWANESWISSWSNIKNANNWFVGNSDRQSREVLIEQVYGDRNEWISHFCYFLPFFMDERYIKINGKPLLLIHRPELIPDLGEMVSCWREEARKHGLEGVYIIGTGCVPVNGALDACLFSAPLYGMKALNGKDGQTLKVYDTEEVWKRMIEKESFPNVKTYYGAFADYDDTPRRGESGTLLCGDSVRLFRKYLPQIMRKNLIEGNDFQFINAWNEWGEGNYLEPDESNGYGYLEAIKDIERSGDYLTEKEYALRDFAKTHKELVGEKVYLYGTGANALALLSRYDDEFSFAGVIDEKKAGTAFCGKRVVDIEEAARDGVESVIFAAQISSVFSIIKEYGTKLKKLCVPLKDLYGNDITAILNEISDKQVVRKSDYEERISNNDIISIDLMDCLLKRDIFSPEIPFVSEQVKKLCEYCEKSGKTVIFVADDSVPVANQLEVLREAGISADNLVIESEYGRNKLNGLFRIIKNMYPGKRILHIGNDYLADVIAPRVYGLDSIGVGRDWNKEQIVVREENTYDKVYADKSRLMKMIENHDTVCFDVFDTLITRLCLEPEDVFSIMEKNMPSRTGIQIDGFARIRINAQTLFPHGDLKDIYKVIKDRTGIEDEKCHELMRYELECEKKMTIPRRAVSEMLLYAKSLGKRTILVSDMYISEDMMRELLESNGIAGFDELIISCDHGREKREGLLDDIRLKKDEKVLFVGDDIQRDIIPAEEKGFESFCIPSSRELLQRSRVWSQKPQSFSPAQRALDGIVASSVFNDPFVADKEAILSAYLTVSLILYTSWLLRDNRTERLDGMIFLSRDGRFFKEAYDHVNETSGKKLPPSFYLCISRSAAIGLIADKMITDGSLEWLGNDLMPSGAISRLLGIPETGKSSMTPEEVKKRIIGNRVSLTKNAENQRRYFYHMLGDSGIGIGKKYGVFDFFSGGTIQSILQITMPDEIRGLYYAVNEANIYSDADIQGAFTDKEGTLKECLVPIEKFICSGRQSVMCYSDEGPVFCCGQEVPDNQAVEAVEIAKVFFEVFREEALTEDVYNDSERLTSDLLKFLRETLGETDK